MKAPLFSAKSFPLRPPDVLKCFSHLAQRPDHHCAFLFFIIRPSFKTSVDLAPFAPLGRVVPKPESRLLRVIFLPSTSRDVESCALLFLRVFPERVVLALFSLFRLYHWQGSPHFRRAVSSLFPSVSDAAPVLPAIFHHSLTGPFIGECSYSTRYPLVVVPLSLLPAAPSFSKERLLCASSLLS